LKLSAVGVFLDEIVKEHPENSEKPVEKLIESVEEFLDEIVEEHPEHSEKVVETVEELLDEIVEEHPGDSEKVIETVEEFLDETIEELFEDFDLEEFVELEEIVDLAFDIHEFEKLIEELKRFLKLILIWKTLRWKGLSWNLWLRD